MRRQLAANRICKVARLVAPVTQRHFTVMFIIILKISRLVQTIYRALRPVHRLSDNQYVN